jgi:dihydrofolate reductase
MLFKGKVPTEIEKVKDEPGKDIERYGSAALMQTLMKHNLIDESLFDPSIFRLIAEAGPSRRA